MKCRKCGGSAAVELRRHNTAYCADDFLAFFRHYTRSNAVDSHGLIRF